MLHTEFFFFILKILFFPAQYFASCVIILTLSTALSVISVTVCSTNLTSVSQRAPVLMRTIVLQYLSKVIITGPATKEALVYIMVCTIMTHWFELFYDILLLQGSSVIAE